MGFEYTVEGEKAKIKEKNEKSGSKALNVAFTAIAAAIIAVCAFITVPLGPVPFTLQTFGVCFAALMLGGKNGAAAVLVYILSGFVGMPVFAGFKSGAGVLFGATGGYLIGFLPMAFIIGLLAERYARKVWILFVGSVLALFADYVIGTAWFMFAYTGGDIALGKAVSLCVTPFILPDILKIALAISLFVPVDKALEKLKKKRRGA